MEAELAAMATERKALGSALGHAPPATGFGGASGGGLTSAEGGARTFVGGVLLGDENAALLRQGTQVRSDNVVRRLDEFGSKLIFSN